MRSIIAIVGLALACSGCAEVPAAPVGAPYPAPDYAYAYGPDWGWGPPAGYRMGYEQHFAAEQRRDGGTWHGRGASGGRADSHAASRPAPSGRYAPPSNPDANKNYGGPG